MVEDENHIIVDLEDLYDPAYPDLQYYHIYRNHYRNTQDLEIDRNVPTHTEDGIPIRKIYVSNLPPKTTRKELFAVFGQFGFIKSCWLKLDENIPNPNRPPSSTYAFVTFHNPCDAHKALQAPMQEKILRGRPLNISPADSWHQPSEDAEGTVCWRPQHHLYAIQQSSSTEQSTTSGELRNVEKSMDAAAAETTYEYDILDILNRDCLIHIYHYIPIKDLIRSERVSKRWQSVIQDYLQGIRVFKTSWWQPSNSITTAVLRRVLQRLGASLLRLHIDNHWALNDRTAHTIGKFCPHLEELLVMGMRTKNWNPIIYGCKNLKSLSFISCGQVTDNSLVPLVKNVIGIEKLKVAHNAHVTGLFLTGLKPQKLKSLSFNNCYSLQATVLCTAIDSLPALTTLKLDACRSSTWKIIPLIIKKLPKLDTLSLSTYSVFEEWYPTESVTAFCEALTNVPELIHLNLSRNVYITNDVLKQVSQSCPKLTTLNVSSCNAGRACVTLGVSDEGLSFVCNGCKDLRYLDISYLSQLTDCGVESIAMCSQIQTIISRGNSIITADSFIKCIQSCHYLKEIDACGCDSVTSEIITETCQQLNLHPRKVVLRLAGTFISSDETLPTHKLLLVNVDDDLSNPQLRPDFLDHIFENDGDDSFDFYDNDDIYFLESDDDDLSLEENIHNIGEGIYHIELDNYEDVNVLNFF